MSACFVCVLYRPQYSNRHENYLHAKGGKNIENFIIHYILKGNFFLNHNPCNESSKIKTTKLSYLRIFDDHRLNIMVEIMDSRDEIGVTEQVW